jgi:hypothetical protein
MVKVLYCVHTEHQFKETLRELEKVMNQVAKAWLDEQMEQKAKWALAYYEGSFRYGIMTTNSSESFNRVFVGVRCLPVSGIVEYSFQKCNEYFVKRYELAQRNLCEQHGPFGKAGQEHLNEAEELAQQHTGEPCGRERHVYSVRGKGGTAMGGEHYGGRNYWADLKKVECTCNVPQIMHAPALT